MRASQIGEDLSQKLGVHTDRDLIEIVCVIKGQFGSSHPTYTLVHCNYEQRKLHPRLSVIASKEELQARLYKRTIDGHSPDPLELNLLRNYRLPDDID